MKHFILSDPNCRLRSYETFYVFGFWRLRGYVRLDDGYKNVQTCLTKKLSTGETPVPGRSNQIVLVHLDPLGVASSTGCGYDIMYRHGKKLQ